MIHVITWGFCNKPFPTWHWSNKIPWLIINSYILLTWISNNLNARVIHDDFNTFVKSIRNTLEALAWSNIAIMGRPIDRVDRVKISEFGRIVNFIRGIHTYCAMQLFYRLKLLYHIHDYLSIDLRVELCESSRLKYYDAVYSGYILGSH